MSCASVRECMQEHLEGTRHPLELAGRLPDWAQRHLEGCGPCREACWQLVNVDCSLRRLSEIPPVPVDLTAGVLAALSAEPAVTPTRDRRWMQVAAALLVLLCLVGWTYVPMPVSLSAGWSLVASWTLPSFELPGLTETMMAVCAGVALLGATALNWRWARA